MQTGTDCDDHSIGQLLFLLEKKFEDPDVATAAQLEGYTWAHRLEKVSSTLNYYLNAVQPVNLLPGEILSQIFFHMQSRNTAFQLPLLPLPLPLTSNPKPYSWLVLTRVCRKWRLVALDTKELWTHICIRGRDPGSLAAAFLDRSDPHLVHVEHHAADTRRLDADAEYRLNEFYDILQSHQDRIKSLSVEGQGRCQALWNILWGTPPNIVDLEVSLSDYTDELDRLLPFGSSTLRRFRLKDFALPRQMFGLAVPGNLSPQKIETTFVTLTHLYLHQENLSGPALLLEVEDLLDLLSALSKNLQVLSLHDIFYCGSNLTIRDPQVTMSQLRHIEIFRTTPLSADSNSDSDSNQWDIEIDTLSETEAEQPIVMPTAMLWMHSLVFSSNNLNLVWSSNHPFQVLPPFDQSAHFPSGTPTVPPPCLRDGITRIVCSPLQARTHALVNKDTLYLDNLSGSYNEFMNTLHFLADTLPNITSVYLHQMHYAIIRQALIAFRRLEDLHFTWDIDMAKIFLDLEDKVQGDANSGSEYGINAYPNLRTLNIRTHTINTDLALISEKMSASGVKPLEFVLPEIPKGDDGYVMVRRRSKHYGDPTTYTLRVISTCIDIVASAAANAIRVDC